MHSNRLLNESVEEHTPGSRPAAVKPKGKFVQVGLHMIRAERTLMGAQQPSFDEGRHAVDSGKYFVRVQARTLDGCASMNIVIPCCQRVRGQSVGENLGAGFYMGHQERSQRAGLGVGDDLNAAAAESFWLDLLYGHSNQNFAGSPSPSFSGPGAANHRFVDLHITGKSRAFSVPNGTTKSVQHRPSGLVRAKPHKAVECFGRNSVFRCCHVPSGGEPYGQGRFRAMEIVPAVAEILRRHALHHQRPSLMRHPVPPEQSGQEKPSGQRSQSR